MTTIIAIIWFTAMLLQLGMAYVCRRGELHQRYPAFAAFIYSQNVMCIFAALVFTAAPGVYFWTYHISFGLTAAFTFLVALECGKLTFGPRIALPGWVPARIATMVASAIGLVTALDLVFAATNGGKLLRAMVTTEQGLTLASLAMFAIVISYSRSLGISGQRQTQKIMRGFVLYLSVDVLAVFIRGSARTGPAVVAIALGMGAYCVSLVYWTAGLWAKQEAPARLTAQQTQELTTAYRLLQEKAKSMGAVAMR